MLIHPKYTVYFLSLDIHVKLKHSQYQNQSPGDILYYFSKFIGKRLRRNHVCSKVAGITFEWVLCALVHSTYAMKQQSLLFSYQLESKNLLEVKLA